jgi:hypothetical protein
MPSGVSTNGTSLLLIRIGAGSIDSTSTYSGAVMAAASSTTNATAYTTGFLLCTTTNHTAASVYSGRIVLSTLGSNVWVMNGINARTDTALINQMAGAKTLSGTLDRLSLTTVNGTDAFDAGSVNIMYEG